MHRSPRSRVAPIAAAVAVFALGLAACGDDDDADTTDVTTDVADVTSPADTAGADPLVTATAPSVPAGSDVDTSSPTTGGGEVGTEDEYVAAAAAAIPWVDEEMSDCAAVALIDAIGYDQIQEVGISAEQFGEDGPLDSGLTIDEAALPEVSSEVAACGDVLGQLASGLGDEERSCVGDNLDNEQLAESIIAPLFGLEPSAAVVAGSAAVEECISGLTITSLAS